jgi:hypothetical protein
VSAHRALALIILTACAAPDESGDGADSAGVSAVAADPADWVVTPRGIGRVQAGMPVEEIRDRVDAVDSTLATTDASCDHIPLSGAPGRVLLMVVDGRVARVEVKDSVVATDRGARVGDSEARIDSLYRGEVRVEPHKYSDGHYLIVTSPAAADSQYRLIFETDGARVTEYRAGLLPQVAWVEGCS